MQNSRILRQASGHGSRYVAIAVVMEVVHNPESKLKFLAILGLKPIVNADEIRD